MAQAKLYLSVGAAALLTTAAGIAGWTLLGGPQGTAAACIGGLASYSKDLDEKSSTTKTGTGIDVDKLQAKIDAEAKHSHSNTTVTSTDKTVQRISQLCWQPCQAWAESRGDERKQLLLGFQECMSEARKGGASSLDSASAPSCLLGLPEEVKKKCACGPAQRAVEVVLHQTGLPQLVVTKIHECMNDQADFSELTRSLLQGEVSGCIDRSVGLDNAIKENLIALVSAAMSSVTLQEQVDWTACYSGYVHAPIAPPTLAAKHQGAGIEIGGSARKKELAGDVQWYEFSLWLDDSDLLPDVKKVDWVFKHPTFEGRLAESSEMSKSFRVTYNGWGCLKNGVTAIITLKDDSRLAWSFDQCNLIDGKIATKGGYADSKTRALLDKCPDVAATRLDDDKPSGTEQVQVQQEQVEQQQRQDCQKQQIRPRPMVHP